MQETSAAKVAVVGGGTMGTSIARWLALRGCDVVLQTRRREAAAQFFADLERDVRRRRRRAAGLGDATWRPRVQVTHTFEGLADRDLVIEAVAEQLAVKQQVLGDAEARCLEDAVLATTTSSICVSALAETLRRPQRLVAVHFFNPVSAIRVVEVAGGKATDAAALARMARFVEAIGKVPLEVVDRPGFLVNRILFPFLFEALRIIEEGAATPLEVDEACMRAGMWTGPCSLADVVGLDVLLAICRNLEAQLGGDFSPPEILRVAVAQERLGRKVNAGIFLYDSRAHEERTARAGGAAGGPASGPQGRALVDRLLFPLLSEALRCVALGVSTPERIDCGVSEVLGWKPGPIAFAAGLGADGFLERADALAARFGERFLPSREVRDVLGQLGPQVRLAPSVPPAEQRISQL